jgi:hypothetical protein
MTITVSEINDGQILWVKVNTDRHENERLWIFTGVAIFDSWHRTDDDDWGTDSGFINVRRIPNAPPIFRDQWIDATAMAAPASFQFRETHARSLVGFSVESARPSPPPRDLPEQYGINVDLKLRGNDAWFHGVSFQLNVLTRGVG